MARNNGTDAALLLGYALAVDARTQPHALARLSYLFGMTQGQIVARQQRLRALAALHQISYARAVVGRLVDNTHGASEAEMEAVYGKLRERVAHMDRVLREMDTDA